MSKDSSAIDRDVAEKVSPVRIREVLDYDPKTGILRWKKLSKYSRFKTGTIAGCEDNGYLWLKIDYKKYSAHRIAWTHYHGKWPIGEIDHVNHIRDDNRICNLRDVGRRENTQNISRLKNNTSGVNGVRYNKRDKRWVASIKVNRKHIHLGSFHCKSEAKKARKDAEVKYGFHLNHGNTRPQR